MKKISIKIDSIGDTTELAENIAGNVKGGEVICLIGELGAGKTYFVKFFAEALGISQEDILSPTFVYWREHQGKSYKINHFDFYRIDDPSNAESTGLEDALADEKSITIIEWADRVKDLLPEDRFEIKIIYLGASEREIELTSLGKKHDHLLEEVK